MDPRLDSSLATYPGADTAFFDVHHPLSPEEVCWIMDQTLCAEVRRALVATRCVRRLLTLEVLIDGMARRILVISDCLYLLILPPLL